VIRPPTWCLVVLLLTHAAVAAAGPLSEERPIAEDPPALLTRAVARHAHLASPLAAAPPRQSSQTSTSATRLRTCHAKKKGALIGAAVGAVAGAAFGTYVARGASGAVLGAGPGARRFIAYWTAGGAGAGALGGLAFCM
jgi:hypothetical protein